MNDQPDFERALRIWLGDGPSEMPDRVVDIVADRITRQPQRLAWRLEGRLPVNAFVKLAAAAAAIAIVAVVGWNLLPGRSGGNTGVGVAPSPTAIATASPNRTPGPIATPCPTSATKCLGPLSPGRHVADQAITPFSYVVPDGWVKTLDVPGSLNLEAVAAPGGMITVIADWAVASQEPCFAVPDPEPGIGRTVDEIIAWLAAHPGLASTAPAPVSIGGLTGQMLELVKEPGSSGPCTVTVNLFTHKGTLDDGGWWNISETIKSRLYVLAAPDGHTVTIHVETNPQADFDPFVQLATPVVETFDFTPG